jgi:hypothetical protein
VSSVGDLLKQLDEIISRLRTVYTGDIVEARDHNDLCDAVRKIREILPLIGGGLPYKTENVSLPYLSVIDKVVAVTDVPDCYGVTTKDSFTDKAVFQAFPYLATSYARYIDAFNYYYEGAFSYYSVGRPYLWYSIRQVVDGYETVIASKTVRLYVGTMVGIAFSVSGSTLKGLAWSQDIYDPLNLPTPYDTISGVSTALASGLYGVVLIDSYPYPYTSGETSYLLPPFSPSKPALAIVEVNVEGSGKREDPFKPAFLSSIVEVSSEGRVKIDLDSVAYGCFEFSPESPTNIVCIFGDNVHKPGAIQRQTEYLRGRGLRVLKPPKDYREASEQYRGLRKEFKHWLAGVHNYCYHTLGLECFNYMQNIDFYYGELIEHKKHYHQIVKVPEWEIRRRLKVLEEKMKTVEAPVEEREKHLGKLKEINARGW